jgi:hypothetical protein
MSSASDLPILAEQGPTSWGAWYPGLPGCIGARDSKEDTGN